MHIEMLDIVDLTSYGKNSRKHSKMQIDQIAKSIKELGFRNPILIDADGCILAGHGRVEAARQLGYGQVPCIRHGDLSPTQRKAYIILDNKIAENASWDMDILIDELKSLKADDFDLGLLGFDNLDKLMIGNSLEDEDELPPEKKTCPECGQRLK